MIYSLTFIIACSGHNRRQLSQYMQRLVISSIGLSMVSRLKGCVY